MPDRTLKISRNNGFRILDNGGIRLDRPLPYQLKLNEYGSEMQFCGATLISSKHAVTAAHCFWDNERKIFKKKKPVEGLGDILQ